MKPLYCKSFNWFFNSLNLEGAMQYGIIEIGSSNSLIVESYAFTQFGTQTHKQILYLLIKILKNSLQP